MRAWVLPATSGLILVVAGCNSAHDHTVSPATRISPRPAGCQAELASALLFDPKPGRFHASEFAVRSDWPSTDAFYSPGQVIYFSERFVDFQGRGFDESDYTYRRFDTYRAGIGFR